MTFVLTTDPELRDLAQGGTMLVDGLEGHQTGLWVKRYLASGGMASVFVAERDVTVRWGGLSPITPRQIAIKVIKPRTLDDLSRAGIDAATFLTREAVALGRIMERRPPTEFVVGYYGCGMLAVEVSNGRRMQLPWLALELVEGGPEGSSLQRRVERAAPDGVDPIRALRLIRRIAEGIRTLHENGIVHRDIKPENILIAGAIDEETPKLTDCGIARVDGIVGTVAGMTPAYGGPEQTLVVHGKSNPLIGPWTDVHAFAAVIWYILTGEDWCRGSGDRSWHEGQRRSLCQGQHLHSAFASRPSLVAQLDAVLAAGAAHGLPPAAWARDTDGSYAEMARVFSKRTLESPARIESVDELIHQLDPLLVDAAEASALTATTHGRPATAFRPTQVASSSPTEDLAPSYEVIEFSPPPASNATFTSIEPGGIVFQPDGKILARMGSELLYFVLERVHRVAVPAEFREQVASCRWLAKGPTGGYLLVGARQALLVRQGKFTPFEMPHRADEAIGDIQAIVQDGGTFAIITEDVEDLGGPELWVHTGVSWKAPVVLPLTGDARSASLGPYGYLVVGASKKQKGRALILSFAGQSTVITSGVNDQSALLTCVSGAAREAWAAGTDFILGFHGGAAMKEAVNLSAVGLPVAMALDPLGVPWLVCEKGILRRHMQGHHISWQTLHQHRGHPLVGLGFTSAGAVALDITGGGVVLVPPRENAWQSETRAG